ncbi:hypothetical protein HMPREF1051_2003 [Neisseria sicca VK64]|uniref:Uncharacterized protein n=1 Tax=Neisseria sicca VK64 TaxID=1095748 RepID=I2NUI1_NEISI|nr:hypothetical protein HMPREF1051_2003 [Neisseria sicca VK64]
MMEIWIWIKDGRIERNPSGRLNSHIQRTACSSHVPVL